MTVAFLSARARRTGAALGAVSAGLLALSACDKPTPLATVTVGTDSVHTEATCYDDGNPIKNADIERCLNDESGKTIKVDADDNLHFGVEPEIADNGWTFFVDGKSAEPEPNKDTYRTVQAGNFFATQTGELISSTDLSIVETKDQQVVGIWHFQLKRKS